MPLPGGVLGPHSQSAIRGAFEQAYGAIYGHVLPELEIEVVSWRVVAEGPRPALRAPTVETSSAAGESALKGQRAAYLPELEGFADVPVYDRYRLAPGRRVRRAGDRRGARVHGRARTGRPRPGRRRART